MKRLVLCVMLVGCGGDELTPTGHCFYANASIGYTQADYCTADCTFDGSAMPTTQDCSAHVVTANGSGATVCVGTYLLSRGSGYVSGCCVPIHNDGRHSTDWYFATCD